MRVVSLAGDGVFWPSSLVAIACLVLLALRAGREAVVLLRALRAFRERWEQALQLRKERGHEPSIDAALA